MTASASFSSSETQISAALFLSLARCRSTQLYDAFSLPPVNHFQNGGSLVSSGGGPYSSPSRRAADSPEHSGEVSSAQRARGGGAEAVAPPMKFCGGGG